MAERPPINILYRIYECADDNDLGGILPHRDNSENLASGLLIRKAAIITLREARTKLGDLDLEAEITAEQGHNQEIDKRLKKLRRQRDYLGVVCQKLKQASFDGEFNFYLAGNYFRGVYAGLRER